jgi:hypothetical protein
MKKIFTILLIFGCATITHNSFTMINTCKGFFKKIKKYSYKKYDYNTPEKLTLEEKKALAKTLDSIEEDRKEFRRIIDKLSHERNLYTKPSDLLNDLSQKKFINSDLSPNRIFFEELINMFNAEFKAISEDHNSEYAWGHMTCLMKDSVHRKCDWLKEFERDKVYKSSDEFTS